jgi:hypothetical protein
MYVPLFLEERDEALTELGGRTHRRLILGVRSPASGVTRSRWLSGGNFRKSAAVQPINATVVAAQPLPQ